VFLASQPKHFVPDNAADTLQEQYFLVDPLPLLGELSVSLAFGTPYPLER
jgi:hypothetical protein